MKPLSACALFGAVRAVSGIRDAFVLQHSVIGCTWAAINIHSFLHPFGLRQASTVVYEENVIDGGAELVTKALREINELYPEISTVFIISGCVPNMIGDDVASAAKEAAVSKKVLHISAPGYGGRAECGLEKALSALAELAENSPAAKTKRPSVNIIGICADDPYAANDVQELRHLFGSKIELLCSLHDCDTEEISRMGAAWLNIVFGSGEALAQKLERSCGTPYVVCSYPYGIQGMYDFLTMLEERLQVDMTAEKAQLAAAGTAIVRRTAYYLQNLYQLPAAVVGDKVHLEGMCLFLERELGMQLVYKCAADSGDANILQAKLQELEPALLLASSQERAIAAAAEVPFLAYTYPDIDELVLTRAGLIGAEGTANLLQKLINAVLQQRYKAEGIWAGLLPNCGDLERSEIKSGNSNDMWKAEAENDGGR